MLGKSKWLLVVSFFTVLISCKKQGRDETCTPDSFQQVFDDFWNLVLTNYVFWDIDHTNWNEKYIMYRPRFQQLDMTDNGDVVRAVQLLREMTGTLVDGHFSIRFNGASVKDSIIYPVRERKKDTGSFDYNYDMLASRYLDSGYVFGFDNTGLNSADPITAIVGKINNEIIYFRCNRFDLYNSYISVEANSIRKVMDAYFGLIGNRGGNIKGIIFDLRNNPGGKVTDYDFMLGHLTEAPLIWGFTKYKMSDDPLKYTPWLEATLKPRRPTSSVASIVALTNGNSQSLAESFVLILKSLGNATIIGEKTFGATGPVTDNDRFYGGSFDIRGFMTVEMSTASFKDLNGEVYEGTGIEPDIQIDYEQTGTSADSQIERAIDFLTSEVE